MYYENFKHLCEVNNVRPADITKATGITSATFSSWKNGVYTPKQEKLVQIAEFFGVPLTELTGDEDVVRNVLYTERDLSAFDRKFLELDEEDRAFVLNMIDNLLLKDKYKKENVQNSEVG